MTSPPGAFTPVSQSLTRCGSVPSHLANSDFFPLASVARFTRFSSVASLVSCLCVTHAVLTAFR